MLGFFCIKDSSSSQTMKQYLNLRDAVIQRGHFIGQFEFVLAVELDIAVFLDELNDF